jgi:hypothetical protein
MIVLFVDDLNWDNPDWLQKRMECESKIASLRQNLSCRETRVVLVLIQDKSTHSDEHQVKERGTELCSSLQLTEKQLFVFPKNENHEIVAQRLDGLFYEFRYFLNLYGLLPKARLKTHKLAKVQTKNYRSQRIISVSNSTRAFFVKFDHVPSLTTMSICS